MVLMGCKSDTFMDPKILTSVHGSVTSSVLFRGTYICINTFHSHCFWFIEEGEQFTSSLYREKRSIHVVNHVNSVNHSHLRIVL